MFQPLITDFIKNRRIQFIAVAGLFFDLLSSGSIIHTLILFGLPYSISVVLNYLFHPPKPRPKAYISAQYRPKPEKKGPN